MSSFRFPVVLIVLSIGAGCSAGTATDAGAGPMPSGRSAAEIEALYEARADSARMRFTPADVAFMTGMIAHHAQALAMADLVPDRTSTPSIRTLAGRITNAQRDEIETLQAWLRDRGEPVPEVHVAGIEVHVTGVDHDARMPGMLTREQLERLAAANGAEFDRLFLSSMIEHHRGAVTMVDELFRTDGAAQDETVFRLASDIQADQVTEIARMERMLGAMSAGGA